MPTTAQRHRFTTWQISGAPLERGVYILWQGDAPICIGATRGESSIRSCLQDHYARRTRPYDASHFSWEIAADPVQREAELIAELRADSRLRRCNAAAE
jgi:hypothetical protein